MQYIKCIDLFESICTVDLILAKHKLKETQMVKWADEIKNKPKLRIYITFKEENQTETYLCMHLDRSERSYLSTFRVQNLTSKSRNCSVQG